ncbi:argininosuccinate lyase [Advenella kashmirensis W13003]|uniref:Argininosuccinate lyase n=1 Tax=Advenella kashmirensis W13003 TaxID=1424334 RepID=V8QUI2_9BURK|nr:argininosuccinate lyase [Advenella kashmirensis]ETF02980.1 argininosuccinate lyase [Advenella kashmirensis W13003]
MESKVSRRLKEPLAQEICELIYAPRIGRDFLKVFPHMTSVNKAHLLMLYKTGLIAPDSATKLARGLLQIESEGPSSVELDPAKEDPYFNYEARLMAITGRDIGGRVHMARSRNDISVTTDRIRARDVVLDILEAVGRVRKNMLERATGFADTIMPGYTHLQPAQPMTLGFYMSGVAEHLGRDMDRLLNVLVRIDICPLGAGAFAGTRFPIDRSITTRHLGFTTVQANTLDSVASRDFAWEAMSAMALLAITWGRVAQDLHVWSTPEFGLVFFPDRVASTSSIMPQKKNPAVLEYLKGKSAHVLGLLNTALVTVKGTHYTHAGDSSRESMRNFWECADEVLRSLSLFGLVMGSVEPRKQHMLEHVNRDFSVATDLADGLVAEADMPFRDAHHIVGELVRLAMDAAKTANELTSEMLDQAAIEVTGTPLGWSEDKLRKYLNPVDSVIARKSGGPAPDSTREAAQRQLQHIDQALAVVASNRSRLEAASREMNNEIKALASL